MSDNARRAGIEDDVVRQLVPATPVEGMRKGGEGVGGSAIRASVHSVTGHVNSQPRVT